MGMIITTRHWKSVEPGKTRMTALLEIVNDSAGGTTAPVAARKAFTIGDVSGSMENANLITPLKRAMRAWVDALTDGTEFAVLTFSSGVQRVFPGRGTVVASDVTKAQAKLAIDAMSTGGGTAMSGAIAAINDLTRPGDGAHLLFLTDGENDENNDYLAKEVNKAKGRYTCDVLVLGTGASVPYMRQRVSDPLLGEILVVNDQNKLQETFAVALRKAQSKGIGNVELRLRSPKTAKIVSVVETAPKKLELTGRVDPNDERVLVYATAPWAAGESRDYLVTLEVVPLGTRTLAEITVPGRELQLGVPTISWTENSVNGSADGQPIFIEWTDDAEKSSRFDMRVASATGEVEKVEARQKAYEALRNGGTEEATRHFNRLMEIVQQEGDAEEIEETTKAIKRAGGDVLEEKDGTRTVAVKRKVSKADLDELDAASTVTKTKQVKARTAN